MSRRLVVHGVGDAGAERRRLAGIRVVLGGGDGVDAGLRRKDLHLHVTSANAVIVVIIPKLAPKLCVPFPAHHLYQ